ncbi:DEAD/DEAH box helicase [Aulosira sp. FACHB-615]|uniref:DEAD/DEAH box helicase n=1 Tax=Aulosira sp. FACHB-615 TaxID=2692777 RepID=UPI001686D2FA|nr:nuclease-related domain-containing DEAD/DEAH box helicase [Aulosira sp. FACHB-615]MBD2492103.1 NERD domain-containing protein [Aulosira sp. FACHB-615]
MVASTENRISEWKFIETEPLGISGEAGEQFVWQKVRENFTDGEGVAFWSYRSFSHEQQIRREADILIVSKDLGLIIIEVKSFTIAKISEVEATRWKMVSGFYKDYIYPYHQAEKQLYALLNNCNKESILKNKVQGRVIVALPMITKTEWNNKGFDESHHTCPPILFKEDLEKHNLVKNIQNKATIIQAASPSLNDQQWKQLLKVIGTPKNPPEDEINGNLNNSLQSPRAQVITKLQDWISDIDWQQLEIGMQFPPGPQRIRGMAGSGKTILLCQKAARMHWRNPEMDIALVFFTRSLYSLILELIDQWLRYFSGGEFRYNSQNSKLRVLHAWGSVNQPGLYSTICRKSGVQPLNANHFPNQLPNEALALACKNLLDNTNFTPIFDAILIDEGQDLIVDNHLKFEGRQPFYWMAYQALRPVNSNLPEQRRLIWAYDEAQSLNSLVIPTSKEVLGTELSQLIGGRGGAFYEGRIRKAHIIRRSYRCPGTILMAAHAIGMGLLRPNGLLAGFTNQRDWLRIGYEVTGDFRKPGSTITLHRPVENSPNPVHTLWDAEVLEFQTYNSRKAELEQLVVKIKSNIFDEKLKPSHNILVIVLGDTQLQDETATYLRNSGIDFYLPTAPKNNTFLKNNASFPNKFWNEGGITVSRIHRAKGHESNIVYILGLDNVARNESSITLRNQLFVALTRTRGWAYLSGIGNYPMYEEMRRVIESKTTVNFTFQKPKLDVSE